MKLFLIGALAAAGASFVVPPLSEALRIDPSPGIGLDDVVAWAAVGALVLLFSRF